MSSKKIIVYIIIALVLASGLFFFYYSNRGAEAPIQEQEAKNEVSLFIDDGGGEKIKTFTAEFKQGMTAYDLLLQETVKTGLILQTKAYDTGILVENIGGIKNGENGKYWIYYINGQASQVAPDKYQLKAGDKVEFKFEKSIF